MSLTAVSLITPIAAIVREIAQSGFRYADFIAAVKLARPGLIKVAVLEGDVVDGHFVPVLHVGLKLDLRIG